jgi:hypothetical protein
MGIEAAIAELERLYPGATRGETAMPGNRYYETAARLDYHLCRCSHGDPSYGIWEFVAEGPQGGAQHVGIDASTLLITCGPKGYHWHRRPVCPA